MQPSPDQLSGCRVVLTAQRRAAEFAAALERRGASVLHAPTLSVVPHVDDSELFRRTTELIEKPPDVTVITTGVGFRGWLEAADAAGVATPLLRVLGQSRLIARGPKARGALQAAGLTADWVAESETSAEIADLLLSEGVAGQRIAIQHHGSGADGLDEAFATACAEVCSLVVYRWGPAPDPAAVAESVRLVARRECDAVAFTSAPGVAAFLDAATEQRVLAEVAQAFADEDGVLAAAVGVITAGPLLELGVQPLVPDRFRLGALVRGIVRELGERRGLRLLTCGGELRLLRGAALLDGEVLPLSPASLAVLRVLAEAGGAVVHRDDILRALPGSSVDPHAAEMAVARLRGTLAPSDLVRTVIRRGYRLAVPAASVAR
ncbi:uroporphyrinogen-III synthase [Naumannella cuiyingiana]|uniref:Uroporphyrinogen-III synthase n=1 Tax=Naumannella cuiyingiana TaxID=1347891 RepID=A0A7Z0IKG9_9ACTN|nr:uroporphyrinogen-III synthase [Naumannella cuiyingiana]NYI70580.1 uroporphyrinogen-III synthase [Naumannella cuiyingiana]